MRRILIIYILIVSYIEADFNFTNIISSVKESIQSTPQSPEEIKEIHFNNLWKDVFTELEEVLDLEEKYKIVPQSSYLGEDQKSVKGDIDNAIYNIYQTLIEDDILSYKRDIDTIKNAIVSLKKDKKRYIEEKVTAPTNSIIKTTKSGYIAKIKEANIEIKAHKNSMESIKNGLQERFLSVGIDLSSDELNIILSKVYGDDIIQMSVVIGLLNQITIQLMTLMQENDEELSYSKRYYGVFMVTLQVVLYTQQRYIKKVSYNFIPKIKNIINNSKSQREETKLLYKADKNKNHKKIYKKNYQIHNFNIEVANLYLKELIILKSKLIKGQNITKDNLKLAKNTYDTVSLSTELSMLINENKNIFNSVMKIQMPELIPFENKEIQNKYIELTNKMIVE